MPVAFDGEQRTVDVEALDGIVSVVKYHPAAGKPERIDQLRDRFTQVFVFGVKDNAYHVLQGMMRGRSRA